ncbi:hypothetical protein MSAN_02063300 [Mycena sanguinolenta]|uniref:Uncharacterized protein n=1 Tax=Mycena sanguinolenta TaxID=230812 RepID=A0A8H7CND6_9AGAR|nr:hypothetical protein MSAN_02063300 [Mycena sanguinolenta]
MRSHSIRIAHRFTALPSPEGSHPPSVLEVRERVSAPTLPKVVDTGTGWKCLQTFDQGWIRLPQACFPSPPEDALYLLGSLLGDSKALGNWQAAQNRLASLGYDGCNFLLILLYIAAEDCIYV